MISRVTAVCDNFGACGSVEGVENRARRWVADGGDSNLALFSFSDFSLACKSDSFVTVPNFDLIWSGVSFDESELSPGPMT